MAHLPYINVHFHKVDNDSGYISADKTLHCQGVHPWNAGKENATEHIDNLSYAEISAIGEIGLDYACGVSRETQREIFIRQLKIAETRELPVIIHCVRAYADALVSLNRFKLKAVVFHCFTGSAETIASIIKSGYYISLSKVSLRSTKTILAIKSIPLEKLFVETDTDDTSIKEMYDMAAESLNVSAIKLKEETYKNYKEIFG